MINGEKEKDTTKISLGTLYDMNKNLVEKYGNKLSEQEILNKKDLIKTFIQNTKNKYYMLLCNEEKDYTVFNTNYKEDFFEMINILVDECLVNRGVIKGIDLTSDKMAIEIWLSIDKESYCYYFFPYDDGIIEI